MESDYLSDPRALARFLSKVDTDAPSGCWLWTGSRTTTGYGQFAVKLRGWRPRSAHRVAYAHFVGPLTDGLVVDHTCHNPLCVNPEHLQQVTNRENVQNQDPPRRSSVTGVRGVTPHGNRFRAWAQGKHVGPFDTVEAAGAAAEHARELAGMRQTKRLSLS